MMRRWILAAAALAAPPPALSAAPLALTGATVHTVSGPDLPGATVVVEDGKIVAVGAGVDVPAGAERVDLTGLHLYPGMIAPQTALGLVEIGSVRGTRDVSEVGNVNPNARAKVAINADSELIPVTRANGVLVAHTATLGSGISGTSVVWKLDGWNWEEMTVREPAGLHVTWPSMTVSTGGYQQRSEEEQKKEREKALEDIRRAFADARAYAKARGAMPRGGPHHDLDVRWEAMGPALERRIPVFVAADEFRQIETALDFARDESLDVVIVGGRDAWRLADRLAAMRVPVVLQNTLELPRRSWEPYDAPFTVAARLHEAGVPFCFGAGSGQGDAPNTRNLPYHAAMAAAYGLPREEALKGVTLHTAHILGVEDRLGSIEPGKDATFFVSDGDPLEIRSHVVGAWIEGRPVDLETRHTRLYDRYRNRPRRNGEGSRLEPAVPAARN
jgi:imidazolonepropionase-like amidohydrolase